jgi:hypothetical protein
LKRRGSRGRTSTGRRLGTRSRFRRSPRATWLRAFAWRRDDRPTSVGGHQADGVAIGLRSTELIEVELTAKRAPRYASIFSAFRHRLEVGDAARVAYLCTDDAARAVRTALTATPAGRAVAPRIGVRAAFDQRGAVRASSVDRLVSDERAILHDGER